MLLLLLTLAYVSAISAATCSFPLSGTGSCTYSSNFLSGNPTVTYVDDPNNPSCLDVNYVTSSGSDYEFTYDIHDAYTLQYISVSLLSLRSVYTGCSSAYTPSIFLVALVYGLSVLLGFDINAKRGLLILGILAVLPIAYSVCSPNPSTITIGVPASYTCPAECTTCTSAITCTGCKSGYYLAGSQCYPECSTTCSAGERCVAGFCVCSGSLYFSVAWQYNGDGDIYVTDPLGNTISFQDKNLNGGQLDHDDQHGVGPENVCYSSTPTPGIYYVCIDDYEDATDQFVIPQRVTFYLNSAVPQTKDITETVNGLYAGSGVEGNDCTTSSKGYLGSYTVPNSSK